MWNIRETESTRINQSGRILQITKKKILLNTMGEWCGVCCLEIGNRRTARTRNKLDFTLVVQMLCSQNARCITFTCCAYVHVHYAKRIARAKKKRKKSKVATEQVLRTAAHPMFHNQSKLGLKYKKHTHTRARMWTRVIVSAHAWACVH